MNEFDKESPIDPDLLARLLESGKPVDPPSEARARMRSALLRRSRVHAPVQNGGLPDALVTVKPDESGEWQNLSPGLDKQLLFRVGNCESFLLRLQPGTVVPAHKHAVDEECVVIDGAICVEGVLMSKGTFHLAPAGVPHAEISSVDGALLYIKSGSFRPTV